MNCPLPLGGEGGPQPAFSPAGAGGGAPSAGGEGVTQKRIEKQFPQTPSVHRIATRTYSSKTYSSNRYDNTTNTTLNPAARSIQPA